MPTGAGRSTLPRSPGFLLREAVGQPAQQFAGAREPRTHAGLGDPEQFGDVCGGHPAQGAVLHGLPFGAGQAAHAQVKLLTVASGGHHDSMITQGIPAAIQWLKALPTPAPAK